MSSHERARVRAAERLDGPLGLTEAIWLEEHLAGCAACAAIAAAYEADRVLLRALAASRAEPPRDLWARTAAAIERESAARGGGPSRVQPGSRRIPLGALSGIAVIAVVAGASAVSSGLFTSRAPLASPSATVPGDSARNGGEPTGSALVGAVPTPFAVGAGNVQWVRTRSDGTFAYNTASVDEVCPVGGQDGCATVEDSADERLTLSAEPETIIGSPTHQQAIVVSRDTAGRQTIFVVNLPPADADTIDLTPAPTTTPAATETIPTTAPTSSVPSDTPTPEPSPTGGATSGPTASPPPSPPPASAAPTEPPATASPAPTPEPSASPHPSASASTDPSASPEPTVAASLAIASGIEVIGPSAAFSADGTRFAFTARPADGSRGPDVYVWSIGEVDARPVTSDARSTFASWAGDQVLVSRPAEGDTTGEPTAPTPATATTLATATTVSIDLTTGLETPAGSTWRPVVDPTGARAVTWEGPIQLSPPVVLDPAPGRLVLRAWPIDDGLVDAGIQVVIDDPVADFDVRWEESGTWFAVWTSDVTDPTLGRLSLFRVDPLTGLLDQPEGVPIDVPALPGFSIGQGRLAWATPPGQGGEGSRVQIVAWAAEDVGTIETAPGEGLIVIR